MNENELLALANSRINEVICKSENNKYNIPAPTPSPPTVIPNTKEQKDLSNLMDSLTIEESITSTINGSPTDSYSPVEPETKQKKKKWPFGFLFKKAIPEPEKSSSTPTTPSLSPSSVLSISPPFQPQLLQERVWAYKLPMAPMTNNIKIWLRFDPENQKRINNLVLQQPNGLIQLFDSRFGQGAIPMVVMPSCKTCYFPLFNGQFDYMAIDYLLNE
jgi:hypothetical protein